MTARKALLSLLTGEAHWGPTGQTAGKVLGGGAGWGGGATFTQFLSHGLPSQWSTGHGKVTHLSCP